MSATAYARSGTSTTTPADVLRSLYTRCRHFLPVLMLDVALYVYFAFAQTGFATGSNTQNLLTSVAVLWVVAMGMTFVLISAGIDLSVGAVTALAGIFLAKVINGGLPGWLAIILMVAVAAALGAAVNGFLVAKGLSFFVVTLASLTALTGVVNLWSNTQTFFVHDTAVAALSINSSLGVPNPIWIMALLFAVLVYVQHRTYFGRDVYAIGGSITAARLSGIRTTRTIVLVWALSAACAGLASVIAVGRVGAASPAINADVPLQAAAAVLIGGTSLHGGAGGVGGTALGVLFLGVLSNGFSLAGVPSFWQQIITGVILVSAVIGDQVKLAEVRRLAARLRPAARDRGAAR